MFWQILLFDQQQQQQTLIVIAKLMDTKLDYIDQSKQQFKCLCQFDGGWIFDWNPKTCYDRYCISPIKH